MRIDRYGEGRVREGWRGRIRGSEAEASLLGDYGSLIPIQRSSTTREKKKPPQAISRRRERERKRKTRLNAFHSSARYVCTLYRVGCLFKIRDTKAQSRYTGARGVQSLRYREREEGGGGGSTRDELCCPVGNGWRRLLLRRNRRKRVERCLWSFPIPRLPSPFRSLVALKLYYSLFAAFFLPFSPSLP